MIRGLLLALLLAVSTMGFAPAPTAFRTVGKFTPNNNNEEWMHMYH